jgi:hypothetical protein
MCQNRPLYIFERLSRDGLLYSEMLYNSASDAGRILNEDKRKHCKDVDIIARFSLVQSSPKNNVKFLN